MENFVLASTSPRRQKLLTQLGLVFIVKAPNYDENILNKEFSYELIENIAENKGLSVEKEIKEPSIIISADTVVIHNNIVLGKPKDFDDAFNMLSALSGKTHRVVTSICIIDTENKKKIIKSDTSKVTFNHLTESDIRNYIDTFSPFDKAGSYGIQELPKNFIKEIEGEFDNIVGLPTKMLINMIEEITNKKI